MFELLPVTSRPGSTRLTDRDSNGLHLFVQKKNENEDSRGLRRMWLLIG